MLRFRPEFDLDDEEDNALLAHHLDEVERGFDFLLTPHLDRRVRRLGVRHRSYVGRLMQRGGGAPLQQQRQILPRQMEEALQRAIREQILQDPEVQPNDHFLININSNRLRHSYHSTRMRVWEWTDNDSQSAGNHATDIPYVELQRTVSIGRFLLPTHLTHSRSRSGVGQEMTSRPPSTTHASSPCTTPTRSNATPTPRPSPPWKKPNATKSSSTNALSIPTRSSPIPMVTRNRPPNSTTISVKPRQPNSMMWTCAM